MSSHYAYRPEIDGLRAIAVLSVVIFHAYEPVLPGGFVGVDIFFVISGFLITAIIQRELELGRFSIAGFYERRVRRIFPSLFVVLLACLPFGWAWMTPGQLQDFFQSVFATSAFLSNVYFFLKTGYFEQSAHVLPLLHTWSLAVEEQYYVIFPVLMILLSKGPRWFLLATLIALLAGSLALSVVWGQSRPMMNFFLLPTRGWELLAGALLALNFTGIRAALIARPRLRTGLELAGFLGLAHGILLLDSSDPLPGLSGVPVLLGTVLLIACMDPRTVIGRVLASQPAVGIGLISYSAYLWHQPVFAFARIHWGHLSVPVLIALLLLTLLLAYLSWRFIENPFRDRNWLSRRKVLWGGVAMIVLFSVIGAVGHLQRGFPQRFDAETLALSASAQISPHRSACHTDGHEYLRPAEACVYGESQATWAMFGDSHGVELALAMSESLAAHQDGIVHLTFSGCPPALTFDYSNPGCHDWVNEAVAFLEASDEIRNVAIIYRTGFHLYGEHQDHGDDLGALATGNPPFFLQDQTPETARAEYWAGLQQIVDRLTASDKQVYLFTPIPELPRDIERIIFDTTRPIADRGNAEGPSATFMQARYGEIDAQLMQFEGPDVHVVRLTDVLCANGACVAARDGNAYYFDDNHLSMAGARAVVSALVEAGQLPLADAR